MDATEKDPAILKNAPKIPGYTILSQLGEGGMATVYLAIQESFGRKVALKVMSPKAQEDTTYGERFLREAKIVARLSHPNIVPVYDVGSAGDFYYISMEHLSGGDLTKKIERRLKLGEVIKVTKEVAAALDYAHRKGYVHRDVKPDNIMFREDGAAVLTDFGIARPAAPDANMTQVGKVIGTPKYMSPEQTKGEDIDSTCDLYALGIMFYEMITGHVPFDGKDPFEIGIKHLKDPVPRLPSSMGVFQPLIDSMLAKNKFKRIQSGREVVEALENIQERVAQRKAGKAGKKTKTPSIKTPKVTNNDKTVVRDVSATMRAHAEDRADYGYDEPEEKKSSKGLVALLLVLVIIGGLAVVWFAPSIAPNSPLMTAHNQLMAMLGINQAEPEPVVVAPPKPEPKPQPAVDPIQEKIKKSLEEAKIALTLGNYVTPFGESALDHYRTVLTLDSENTEAKLGIADIANLLVAQANEAINTGDFEKARELLTQARSISPNIPGLITAEANLKQQEAAQNQNAAAEAAEAERQARLAAEREAARKAEEARLAEEKRKQEAEAARLAAEEAARQERIRQMEEEERLRQEELARQKAQEEAAQLAFAQVRIKGILAKADTYLGRGDVFSPPVENALDQYSEVLTIDTNNAAALAGLEKVIAIVIPEINALLEAQQHDAAKALYDRAIAALPSHTELVALGKSKGW